MKPLDEITPHPVPWWRPASPFVPKEFFTWQGFIGLLLSMALCFAMILVLHLLFERFFPSARFLLLMMASLIGWASQWAVSRVFKKTPLMPE